jgi:hypothetical protein
MPSSVDDVVVIGRRPQAESEAAALQIQRDHAAFHNVPAPGACCELEVCA